MRRTKIAKPANKLAKPVVAKLTSEAQRDLLDRIGNHAAPYLGPFMWDGAIATAQDGSRRDFHPSEIVIGTAELGVVNKSGVQLARFTFPTGVVQTFKPYWFDKVA